MHEYELQFIEDEPNARNISQEMFMTMYTTDEKKQREITTQFLHKIN